MAAPSPGIVIGGAPTGIYNLVQEGLIERAFHDSLMPNLMYRSEAMFEPWQGNQGQEIFETRQGLLRPKTTPLMPGTDPVPQRPIYEQWSAKLAKYADAIDIHMPTSVVSSINQFLADISALGKAAGQAINLVARNALFQAYLSGSTALTAAASSSDTSISVASLNGFTDVIVPGTNLRPVPVSSTNPLPVTIYSAVTQTANVIGAIPSDATDPNGPGTLVLAAGLAQNAAIRVSVVSKYAPRILRTGGGTGIDALSSSDTLTIQDIVNAVAVLRKTNVPPHEDGTYHAHLDSLANAQFFADPVFQRLNQSLPQGSVYQTGLIDKLLGVTFYMNNESPGSMNAGDSNGNRISTGSSAYYSQQIGGETTNGTGVDVGHTIITGRGALYERTLDESAFITEAGINGKIGEFDVMNNGYQVQTERIRFILRAPMDRLMEFVSAAYSITTAFAVPSDATAPSGPERFKRAIVIQSAT